MEELDPDNVGYIMVRYIIFFFFAFYYPTHHPILLALTLYLLNRFRTWKHCCCKNPINLLA